MRVSASSGEGSILNHTVVSPDFKAFMMPYGWADWMKPSRKDIEVFLLDREKLRTDIVPFSVARISPWSGPEEFDRFFPSADPDGPFWIAPVESGKTGSSPIIDLRHHKIGPKWPPGSIQMDVQDAGDQTRIQITFNTPWAPIDDIAALLDEVCRAHGARFLLTWIEEQGLCGYTYSDPAAGTEPESNEWGFENQWQVEVEDEEDPEQTWTQFDRDAFESDVSGMISDPDL